MISKEVLLERQLLLSEKDQALAKIDSDRITTVYGQEPTLTVPNHAMTKDVFPEINEKLAFTQAQRIVSKLNGVAVAGLPVLDSDNTKEYNLFTVPFGRDALIFALDMLELAEPEYRKFALDVAKKTLLFFASVQGTKNEPTTGQQQNGLLVYSMEEIGKIPHEVRNSQTDEIAQKLSAERQFGWPYYASMDATPLFVTLASRYLEVSNDLSILDESVVRNNGLKVSFRQCLKEAVNWITNKINGSPYSLIESSIPNQQGALFQGWRDAFDSHYIEESGEEIPWNHQIASIEIQGLAFDALWKARKIVTLLNIDSNNELITCLNRLRKSVIDNFYITDEAGDSYFALGSDRIDNVLRIHKQKTSAMGWLLNSEMLVGAEYEQSRLAIVKTLFSDEMLTNWGIRTLSSKSKRFLASSYHNGSNWKMDDAQNLKGLVKNGYIEGARFLANAIVNSVEKTKLFVEFQRGDSQHVPTINSYSLSINLNDRQVNVVQPPQPVQAWTISAYLYALSVLAKI